MTEETETPTEEQQDAVDSSSRDILVEAGAGTGKTKTTVVRYERLLENLQPNQVLVFTFTEKAASELRARVRKAREQQPDRFSMSSVWIGTFHSICARILRAHPIAAGVDPRFAVIDSVRAHRVKQQAWQQALDETVRDPDAERDLARFTPRTLREGMQHVWEQLRALGQTRPELPDPPPHRSPAELHTVLLAAAVEAQEVEGLRSPTPQKIENLVAGLKATPAAELNLDRVDEIWAGSDSGKIEHLRSTADEVRGELAAIDFGDRVWVTLGKLLERYGDTYSELKLRGSFLDYDDLQLKTLELLRSSNPVKQRYNDQFHEIMVDEFQDTNQLQMELIRELRGDETTLFTVGDEMQSIYSFRFADVELFRERREIDEPDGPDEEGAVLSLSANFRSEAKVIGAINQIGRRLEDVIADLRTGDEPGNPEGGTAHKFADLRVGFDPTRGKPPEVKPIEPGVELMLTATEDWSGVDLGPLSPPIDSDSPLSDDERVKQGRHEAEALAVAQRIREMIDGEGAKLGKITILFRTHGKMWMFEEALKQAGVRPYTVGGSRFWETREGIDLRSLIGVIANPLDDESLLGSLAGPACGLSADALWVIARNRGWDVPVWERLLRFSRGELTGGDLHERLAADRDRALAFVNVIEPLREQLPALPLSRVIATAVTETGYDLVNLQRDPSGVGLANIRHVFDVADEFEAADGRDLRGLVEWIDESTSLNSEQAVATAGEDDAVVRLITCHAAKGLEFETVVVADLGHTVPSANEDVIWVAPRPDSDQLEYGLRLPTADGDNIDLYAWKSIAERARSAQTDEELRVLHVAMTRAERRLVLSGLVDFDEIPEPTESRSPIELIARALELEPEVTEEVFIHKPVAVERYKGPTPQDSTVSVSWISPTEAGARLSAQFQLERDDRPTGRDGTPPVQRRNRAPLPEVPLSYSALAGYLECPARFYATRVLRLKPPANDLRGTDSERAAEIRADEERSGSLERDPATFTRREATSFGNAVHALLEKMPAGRRRRVGDEPGKPGGQWVAPSRTQIANALAQEGADTGDASIDRAAEMITGFIKSPFGIELEYRKIEVEQPLLVKSDEVMIRGFVDVIATGPDLVLDYKTNRLDGGDPETAMSGYELQRDLYAVGVAAARDLDLVDTAYVFLEDPDRPVRHRYDRQQLAEAKGRIDELVGEVRHGYEPGRKGSLAQPCGDCWACDLFGERSR